MEDLNAVDWQSYDFVDLGCSKGGSLEHGRMRFGVEAGIGIDIDPRKVELTRRAGFDAVIADARALELEGQVSFITMLDFFEHLPDLGYVFDILEASARSARDFLYIKHPSFEGEEAVTPQGLRQYWWDWHGHTCHVRVADYCAMFEELGLNSYKIRYLERVDTSRHPSVVSVGAPRDLSAHDAAALEDHAFVEFAPPLWRRQDIFVALRTFEPIEWAAITKPTAQDRKMLSAGKADDDPQRANTKRTQYQ